MIAIALIAAFLVIVGSVAYLKRKEIKTYFKKNKKKIAAIAVGGLTIGAGGAGILIFNPGPVGADTDFYVSTDDGSDAYNGLYPTYQGGSDGPWLTILKVNTEYGSDISQGDDIYFNRGNTWNDSGLGLFSGSESDQTVYGAYGTGVKPKIEDRQNNIYSGSAVSWITIQDICIGEASGAAAVIEGTGSNNITFKRMTFDNGGLALGHINYYRIENCDFDGRGLAIQGDSSDPIRNGIIRNCTFANCSDGLTLHYSGNEVDGRFVGPNHWIENCTGHDCSENSFDITSGYNIYLQNCTSYGSVPGILVAHNARNVTIDNLYSYNEVGSGIYFTEVNNTIVRNSIFYNFSGRGFYLGATPGCHNVTIYNNDIIFNDSTQEFIQMDTEVEDVIFKNNIFHSINTGNPTGFVQLTNPLTFSNINSNWSNNIWWKSDGVEDDLWSCTGASYNFTEWLATSEVTGDLGANPLLTDVINEDFTLQSNSPCIDAGAWLTTTNGGSTDTTITVHESNYFFPGLSTLGVSGDNIFVGSNTNLEVTSVDYTAKTITVNRSITWDDGDVVSLSSYNGLKVDIGSEESTSYSDTIHNNGEDYFMWLGVNTTASIVDNILTGFDESTEYIAIWNLATWSSTHGLWDKWYGDSSGTDFSISTFDVIKVYLTDDSGTQTIYMSPNTDMSYTVARNRTITKTSQNKGYNYTGYYLIDVTTLSGIADKTNLTTGEMIAWWDSTNQEWKAWIIGFSTTDYNTGQFDVFMTIVSVKRYLQVG